MRKQGVKFVAAATAFGLIASAAFQGSNYLLENTGTGQTDSTATVETASLNMTDASDGAVATASTTSETLDVSAIAAASMPSVVSITNKGVQEVMDMFGGTQSYESESCGSGIIIGQTDTELLIVTNNHVIESAETLSVSLIDDSVYEANIKGTDPDHDLAVISVSLEDVPEDTLNQIAVAELGNSSDLQVGEQVVAIGNALGYGQSVTTGIVSALNREVTIDDVTNTLIQTDAAINPGNSGGALLNMQGQLVGINSAKYSDTSVEGMGYAIPVDDVLDIIEDLMNRTTREKVSESEQGVLGITGQDVTSEVAEAYDIPVGVYITTVAEGSGAEAAQLIRGDIITKIDGTSISSLADLQEQLSYYSSGETIELTVSSAYDNGYTERTVSVTLNGQSK